MEFFANVIRFLNGACILGPVIIGTIAIYIMTLLKWDGFSAGERKRNVSALIALGIGLAIWLPVFIYVPLHILLPCEFVLGIPCIFLLYVVGGLVYAWYSTKFFASVDRGLSDVHDIAQDARNRNSRP
jgi:hypothetical protein